MAQSKFMLALTNNGASLRQSRAALLQKQAKNAQENLIRGLEAKMDALKVQEDAMTDFGPKSTYDLTVGNNADMTQWTAKFHDLQVEMFMIRRELKIAKKVKEVWFDGDEPEVSGNPEIEIEGEE